MSVYIVIALVLGGIAGAFLPEEYKEMINGLSTIILYILIFYVGIDLGLNRDIFPKIKSMGAKVLLVPLGELLGSFAAGVLLSLFMSESMKESLSVTMGMGWYSFSGIIITEAGNPSLGATAFLSNIFRELIAFITVPFIAKHINHYCAIATAGATSMDTTLGIISRNTNGKAAVVSFISGITLTMVVPLIVPVFV
ncbi:MAG: lysine exporter LysO family protein [Firmicutes bacterium]|nr:lysine exporter LysO family protein [Bacillota bacterium]